MVDVYRARVAERLALRRNDYEAALRERDAAAELFETTDEALKLVKACRYDEETVLKFLEQLQSTGLTEVYGEPYEFSFERSYDGQDLKGLAMRVSVSGGKPSDPFSDCGGGVGIVVTTLFLFALFLLRKDSSPFLIVDELGSELDVERWVRFQRLVETVAQRYDIQVIMATHSSQPQGKVYRVEKRRTPPRISTAVPI